MNGHDKIRNQSKEWLAESMLELMRQKPYQDITIGLIAEHANLSRRTFYRVFHDKDDILNYITNCLSLEYLEHVKSHFIKFELLTFDIKNVSMIFFSFFEEHYEILKLFKKNGLEYQLLNLFNQYLPLIYKEVLSRDVPDEYTNPLKLFTLYNIGGFFNILMYWLEKDQKLTAKEMSSAMDTAFSNYLK